MACFVVPAAEAVITSLLEAKVRSDEKKADAKLDHETEHEHGDVSEKIRFSTKLGWLNKLLWGGSALLAFEHVWHGEVIPTFPFLTAVTTGETSEMLAEMGTVGVTMAVLVTAVWGGMVVVSNIIEKRSATDSAAEKEG